MNTYHLNTSLNKKEIIDILYNSNGYYLEIDESTYNKYSVNDKVVFNCKFNKNNLKGNIIRKEQYPREQYKVGDTDTVYIFIVDLEAKIEVICLWWSLLMD